MEEEVQVRVQVEVGREEQGEGETHGKESERRDNEEQTLNRMRMWSSRCFVKRSAVLFFVPTRLTDRRFSRIHCCIDKHRISMCLSPPGPLSCRMCLAESESISRRTETL